MADKRFVRPNTMYIEGSPVIECSIVLNRSLQDMLLQSWGGKINVFAAIPQEWDSAVFHDLRAEGAFLVSAKRKAGSTAWVRIKSLAGEPCRVQPNLDARASLLINGKRMDVKASSEGIYELPLDAGDEAVFYRGQTMPELIITPLPAAAEDVNPFGGVRKLKPSLATGSTATASSMYSKTYAPSKAVDNDPTTRWAGAHGTRGGWLEVDLGQAKTISRVVIHELQFPSTQAFTVECDVNGTWREVADGTTIAGVKQLRFSPVTARRVRLKLLKTVDDVPTIGEFQVF